jgi:hypothetical protein
MILAICSLIAIYVLYVLLIKGLLWKIILAIFGWLGLYWCLSGVDGLSTSGITVSNYVISWAVVLPSVLVMLAMMYTKED